MLSTEKIPNLPLNGQELKQYSLALLKEELECRSVPSEVIGQMTVAYEKGCDNDFLFRPNASYPGMTIEMQVRLHRCGERCAFTIMPTYTHMNPLPPSVVLVRSAAPPLLEREGDEQVEAFTLKVKISNPNLVRIHYDIPIVVTKRVEPLPGEMFGRFEPERQEFDPLQFPEPEAPVVKDESEEFAKQWGVSKEVMPADAIMGEPHPVNEAGTNELDVPASSKKQRRHK